MRVTRCRSPISAAQQQKGIASAALRLARSLKPGAILEAEILPANGASIELFRRAGYMPESPSRYRSEPAHNPPSRARCQRTSPSPAAPIGPGEPPYVVAELSANHGGSLSHALAVMEAAKAAGADAVKLQTYTADTITIDHDGPDFRSSRAGCGTGAVSMSSTTKRIRRGSGTRRCSPRAASSAFRCSRRRSTTPRWTLLEGLDAPAYKIASFEMIDLPLIRRVATTGKPIIMSTGMGSPEEIAEAVEAFRGAGGRDLVLLHCVSGYPTPVGQSNLRRIPDSRPNSAVRSGCPITRWASRWRSPPSRSAPA